MKVLIAVASKHGATAEIGEAIGEVLAKEDLEASVFGASGDLEAGGYDAFIVGSAVYAGHWLKEAKEFIEANTALLAERPVWLFSSGPIGDPPKPEEDPVDVSDLVEATAAAGHELFAGKLDKDVLGFGERAIISALRAPTGDFREWEEIRGWAKEIAARLKASQPGF